MFCLFFVPQFEWLFQPKMEPKGTHRSLKIAQNLQKMLPRTTSETVWRPSLEQVASPRLPETSPYASHTVNTMVLALPTTCHEAQFLLHSKSIWGTFWAPWASKVAQGMKKRPSKKTLKHSFRKQPSRYENEAKNVSNPDKVQTILGIFFCHWVPLTPKWLRDPFGAFVYRNSMTSDRFGTSCSSVFCFSFFQPPHIVSVVDAY